MIDLAAHTLHPGGIRQIRLPMADHALKYINAYLIAGDDGYTLIDCGWGTPDVLVALRAVLDEIGVRIEQIKTVVATHFHTDHYGLAGTLAREAGAKVMMHAADWGYLDTHFRDLEQEMRRRDTWLVRNGLEVHHLDPEERMNKMMRRFILVAPSRELADGEILEAGRRRFRVVWTPGHSPGHICLYDEERGVLLTGDHILPGISPHVGAWSEADVDPLGKFLSSLRKVAALGAKSALPAHREPIADVNARVEELLEHHDEREALVLEALGNAWRSGGEIAAQLPWRRGRVTFENLPVTEKGFAVVETAAHLQHLLARGKVERREAPDIIRYHAIA